MTAWEIVEPVISLMTAVSSLTVATIVGMAVIQNQKDQRQHHRLSVKPRLHFSYERLFDSRGVRVVLENNGLGPALIKDIYVKSKKGERFSVREKEFDIYKEYFSEYEDFYEGASAETFDDFYTLSVGREFVVFSYYINEDGIDRYEGLYSTLSEKLHFGVVYECLYGIVHDELNP